MNETNQIVAAIFAASFCQKLNVTKTEDFLFQYGKFLSALEGAETKGDEETPGIIKYYTEMLAKKGGPNA